ncbi:MAG: ABC transporter substrate-binding protein [Gaiellaceae bacterium]|jgi:polar amino acid transport system substrate-binding protein
MRKSTFLALLATMLTAVLVVAVTTGCGSKKSSSSTTSAAGGGTITFCSDTTYPPMESLVNGKAVGADIDIANAIAKLWGEKAQIDPTGFAGIIGALTANKCDAVISALTDTAERRKTVDFADYITVGMLLMVAKGNPAHISNLNSLSGKTVAVEAATTEKDTLDSQNKIFAKEGKPKITIQIYPADTNAAIALLAGKVDAYFADATPVLYYMKKNSGFEVAGKQIAAAPEGIATRKGDPLGPKFEKAISKLYASGEMQKILAKWGLSKFALAT